MSVESRWINGRLLVHGTLQGYCWKRCRCSYCRGAFVGYQRQRRADLRAAGLSARGRELPEVKYADTSV